MISDNNGQSTIIKDNNIQTKKLEDDKCMQYFRAKSIIQKISQRCSDKNRIKIDGEKDCIIVQPQFVDPGYKIEGFYLLPEKIYVYKIYQFKEEPQNDMQRQYLLRKILICPAEKIELQLKRGIHVRIENYYNDEGISMYKKPDGSTEISVVDIRSDGKKERYFIHKKKGGINKEELYEIKYEIEKKGQGGTTSENHEFQNILNSIIPIRGFSERVISIGQLFDQIKLIQPTNNVFPEVNQILDKAYNDLFRVLYPILDLNHTDRTF